MTALIGPYRSSGHLLADRRYAYAEAALADDDAHAAADLLAQTLEIVPRWAPAWFLLGEARLVLGDRTGAVEAFRAALDLAPTDELGAGARLARLGAADAAAALSPAYVQHLFDAYAPRFEEHLRGALGYRGPELIRDALVRASAATGRSARFTEVIDLGCGTGLMGEAIRPEAERLIGCDLSSAMIAKAAERGIYDGLEAAELLAFLAARAPCTTEAVLAADVLVYVGDLAPLFAAVERVLVPGGLFAFTVQDPGPDADGFTLGADLRYGHGEGYVRRTAQAAGSRIVLFEEASARLDRGVPVPGRVVVMKRIGDCAAPR